MKQSVVGLDSPRRSGWERIFKDPMTTAAAVDRLVHHSVILELNLSGYRMEVAKKRKTRKRKGGQQTGRRRE